MVYSNDVIGIFMNIWKLDTDLIFMAMILLMVMVSKSLKRMFGAIFVTTLFGNISFQKSVINSDVDVQYFWRYIFNQLILVGYGLGQQAATSELSLHAKLRFGFCFHTVSVKFFTKLNWNCKHESENRAQLRHTVRKLFNRSEEKYWNFLVY